MKFYVKPIPKYLLIHDITYQEKIAEGRYDSNGFSPAVAIKNVLVQPVYSVKRTGLNKEIFLKATLFIDCVNTEPALEMTYQSIVTFEGQEFIVQSVKRVYGFILHHYEVDLV